MARVELIKASVSELDPNKNYVIGLNQELISKADAAYLMECIEGMGVKNIVVAIFKGDPNKAMKIVEQKKK